MSSCSKQMSRLRRLAECKRKVEPLTHCARNQSNSDLNLRTIAEQLLEVVNLLLEDMEES